MGRLIVSLSYRAVSHIYCGNNKEKSDRCNNHRVCICKPFSLVYADSINVYINELAKWQKEFDYTVIQGSLSIIKTLLENDFKFDLLHLTDKKYFDQTLAKDAYKYNIDHNSIKFNNQFIICNNSEKILSDYVGLDSDHYYNKLINLVTTHYNKGNIRFFYDCIFIENYINYLERKKFWKLHKIHL